MARTTNTRRMTTSEQKSASPWSLLIVDKIIIGLIVLAASTAGNLWAERIKALDAAKLADANTAVSKAGELWEAMAKFQSSLERISALKLEQDISVSLSKRDAPDYEKRLEQTYEESRKARQAFNELASANLYYVGKPMFEHMARYAALLEAYYTSKDSVMFSPKPKNIDLSFSHKRLQEMGEQLYKMRLEIQEIRDYAVARTNR